MTSHQMPVNRHKPGAAEYRYVRQTEEFQQLRTTFRSFTFPMTIAGLVWFVAYVTAAMFMPDVMAKQVVGLVNLGMVLGLAQFATTFLITWLYISFANNKLEPMQAKIREEMETGQIAEQLAAGNNGNASGK